MIGPMPYFRTIGEEEIAAVVATMRSGPLSGYLGGELTGGLRVEALEYEFARIVGSRHAVAVNSGTSGLLCACEAVGVSLGARVLTTPYTMSATAAVPTFLNATVEFGDIEDETFCLDPGLVGVSGLDAVIVTNLFGHPAKLSALRQWCDRRSIRLIEDNAQAIFAREGRSYAGTVGHIGVYSFNVHKHLQCGEGGICVTDDAALADRMRRFRNHAELFRESLHLGLNLRMTETTAAIALAQLAKREQIISGRIELAEEMTDMVRYIPGLLQPIAREDCKHVYYSWAILLEHDRDWFVNQMVSEGVPLKAGYVTPLHLMPVLAHWNAFKLPVVEAVEKKIAIFEICGWDPTSLQRKQMREAFQRVGEKYAMREGTSVIS